MERIHETVCRFVFVCAVGIGGCATSARTPESPRESHAQIVVPTQHELARHDNELLRYIESVRAMPAPQLEHEATIVDHDARAQPNVANRLRLGVFLGFAPPPFRATGRAQEILDGVWRDDNGEQREIVRLLLAVLHDRQELEATLHDERRQRQALRHKLDQLKAIEEDLDRRMQPSVINPR